MLTGPAGTAKTATVRVLSPELEFEILEWRNTMDEHFARTEDGWNGVEYEGLSEKFRSFLMRAASCRPIFASTPSTLQDSQSTRSLRSSRAVPSTVAPTSGAPSSSRRQVILLEDLPNILHQPTQEAFHSALEAFVASPDCVAPIVLIVSDAGLRGEDEDADGARWKSRGKDAIDVRNVLSHNLLNSPCVRQIKYASQLPCFPQF